jgi:hypothetical protein
VAHVAIFLFATHGMVFIAWTLYFLSVPPRFQQKRRNPDRQITEHVVTEHVENQQ